MLREAPSTYAAGDIQDATTLARRIICNYGMAATEVGLPTFTYKTQFAGGRSLWQRLSAGAALLDNAEAVEPQWDRKAGGLQLQVTENAVDAVIAAAHEQNVQLLEQYRDAVVAVQQRLLEKDNVYGSEIEARALAARRATPRLGTRERHSRIADSLVSLCCCRRRFSTRTRRRPQRFRRARRSGWGFVGNRTTRGVRAVCKSG